MPVYAPKYMCRAVFYFTAVHPACKLPATVSIANLKKTPIFHHYRLSKIVRHIFYAHIIGQKGFFMNNMNKQNNEPQSLQSDSYDFSVTTKTTSTQKMSRKGPRNIPLLPRHHIYLFCVNGDGDRFVEIFRAVWRQLPLKHRRAFLKHWRTWPVLKLSLIHI